MDKIDKLILLDACANGDLSKLKQLLDQAYSGFNTFFNICKNQLDPKNAEDYIYYGNDDSVAKFGVVQKSTMDDVEAVLKNNAISKDIEIVKNDDVIMVNIHIS